MLNGFCHSPQMLGLTWTAVSKLPDTAALMVDAFCGKDCSCTVGDALAERAASPCGIFVLWQGICPCAWLLKLAFDSISPRWLPSLGVCRWVVALCPWQQQRPCRFQPWTRTRALLTIYILKCSYVRWWSYGKAQGFQVFFRQAWAPRVSSFLCV